MYRYGCDFSVDTASFIERSRVPLEKWITVAVAQKIGVVETAADFLNARRGTARPEDLTAFLDQAANEPPQPGDSRRTIVVAA
jgi:hypothetical protein